MHLFHLGLHDQVFTLRISLETTAREEYSFVAFRQIKIKRHNLFYFFIGFTSTISSVKDGFINLKLSKQESYIIKLIINAIKIAKIFIINK